VQRYYFAGVLESNQEHHAEEDTEQERASPQPCFVPFDTSNYGERSPFSITDALIPSWNDRMMSTRAAGQPILLRIARIERFGEIDEDGIQVLLMLFGLFL